MDQVSDNDSDTDDSSKQGNEKSESIRLMKDEHNRLIVSLTAVTTHFAHVQFRLRQVIHAPLHEKEKLLRELEEFTFKGIPDFDIGTERSSAEVADQIKDKLISQLKTQISELETSIEYLQKQSTGKQNEAASIVSKVNGNESSEPENLSDRKMSSRQFFFIKKLLAILHIVNVHCNEEKDNLKRDLMKTKQKINHWGDARARLEVAITDVIEIAEEPSAPIDSDYMSDSEGSPYYNQKLATVVRRQIAPAIQSLIEHGLISDSKTVSIKASLTFVIGCVPRSSSNYNDVNAHAWELILKYYHMKNGDQFNSAPALKLSQSYNLEVGNNFGNSNVQKLLVTIGNIVSTHSQFKRSYNSQFKAFICAGLNYKLLVTWLQIIYRSKHLIEMYYEPWSYALKIGFEDCCKSLEKLNHIHFNLPVDMAVHGLQNIKDAFY